MRDEEEFPGRPAEREWTYPVGGTKYKESMVCGECPATGYHLSMKCKKRERRLRSGARSGHFVSCPNLNLVCQNHEKLLNGVEWGMSA